MTVRAPKTPPYDLSNPPMGTRIQLGVVAAEHRVTMEQLAAVAGISKTAMVGIVTANTWPVRTDPAAIRTAIVDHFRDHHSVPEEQLQRLFWALGPHRGPHTYSRAATLPHALSGTDRNGRSASELTPPTEEPDMLMPKQTLSPQAARHFRLFRNPFANSVTRAEEMFEGGDVRYVREAAWQCAQHAGFVAIVGESGAGKTTIQDDLEARLLTEAQPVVVIKPSVLGMEESNAAGLKLKSTDILHAILSTLDPGHPVPQTLQARTVRAHKLLGAGVKAGSRYLLAIEEAHSLPDPTLKHLKRLHELRDGRHGLLGILLIGQPELKARLANGLRNGTLREVSQRCEVVELLPLDNDLRAYLECRAATVQVRLDQLLAPEAIDAIRARLTIKRAGGTAVSMCYPLAVNNLITRCLNVAAELGVPLVNKDVVTAA